MAIFKCKMCGGSLSVQDRATVAECEYCGTTQTIPTSTDEVIVQYFNRANYLRQKSEYDKAAEVYEKILDLDNTQAEAHWGVVLCKYGVEYVEDPLTKERIPTCHRTQMTSLLTDADYQAVLQYADSASRAVYKEQAEAINELQKKILQIVKSEKPFDVFICYKETDESGARTKDSVIANEIYHELTNSGLKVFFAAITLEDKLGQEYEPYIFAALTSAKVMLVLGTKEDYFKSVWVRNEWSRYLHLMKTDRTTKRTLIPCFRDMDAYALPDEFAHLQALDMASIAFMPDLTRNIQKLIGGTSSPKQNVPTSDLSSPATQIEPLLKRAFMMIEDGEFKRADELLETVLNNDPENARAYLGKFMCDLQVVSDEEIGMNFTTKKSQNLNYKKALRFADDNLKNQLDDYPYRYACNLQQSKDYVGAANEFRRLADYKDSRNKVEECVELENARVYALGLYEMESENYLKAIPIFQGISGYKDSDAKANECIELQNQGIYTNALNQMNAENYHDAAKLFKSIWEYRDSNDKAIECWKHVERLKEEADETRNLSLYNHGISLMNSNQYEEAIETFSKIRSYKDASAKITKCNERIAKKKRNDKIGSDVVGTLLISIIAVPIGVIVGGIIGIVVGLIMFISGTVPGMSIIINFAIIGGFLGVVVAYIGVHFGII